MNERLNLHALADGELSGEAKEKAEALMASDPALQAEFEAIRGIKGALKRVQPETCARTWARCRERLGELDKRQKAEGFVTRWSWGLCTLFAAAILGGALLNRAGGGGMGTADAARMISGLTPFSRSSGGQAQKMSDWVVKPRGSEIRLIDRIEGWVQGRPVQRLAFEDAQGRFVVLAVGGISQVEGVEPMLEAPAYSMGKVNGVNCVTWPMGTNTMFLVADRPHVELAELARRLQSD